MTSLATSLLMVRKPGHLRAAGSAHLGPTVHGIFLESVE
jgi:hypothetical protein